MASNRVIGIDLGTTYSCVSFINDNGQPEILMNDRDERTTPSVVWFEGNRVVVGQEAKEIAGVYPESVCSFVKRYMGDDSFYFEANNKRYRSEEISSLILRKLVQDASKRLGEEIRDVVITCPAYFFVKERDATKFAGELAGLNVLQIVNEPTAAAVAYGVAKQDHWKSKTIMVYDLGGGTFDVTLIHISPESMNVICTDGDHRLGGKDWDDHLVRHFVRKFQEETGSDEDLLTSPEATWDLVLLAEQTKKHLSSKPSTPVKFSHGGESIRFDVTREEFENLTAGLLERTIMLSHRLMEAAELKGYSDIDAIVLVGGSTRMPMVTNRLFDEFLVKPEFFDPDEAVAKGAAIIGNDLRLRQMVMEKVAKERADENKTELLVDDIPIYELESAMQTVANDLGYTLEGVKGALRKISNVASKSFGVVALSTSNSMEPKIFNLIYRNDSLPKTNAKVFGTVTDNQQFVEVEIMENNTDNPLINNPLVDTTVPMTDGTPLWKGELLLPPRLPEGSPISVEFRLDENGLLTVCAVEKRFGNRLEHTLQTGSIAIQSDRERDDIKKRCTELIVE